jgi:hypothetical protein
MEVIQFLEQTLWLLQEDQVLQLPALVELVVRRLQVLAR